MIQTTLLSALKQIDTIKSQQPITYSLRSNRDKKEISQIEAKKIQLILLEV